MSGSEHSLCTFVFVNEMLSCAFMHVNIVIILNECIHAYRRGPTSQTPCYGLKNTNEHLCSLNQSDVFCFLRLCGTRMHQN